VIHNHSLELASDLEHWSAAHMTVADKWDGRMPGVGAGGGTWKQRARRAEAEAAVTRAAAFSTQMKIDARCDPAPARAGDDDRQPRLALTAPLRRVTARQRRRADRQADRLIRPATGVRLSPRFWVAASQAVTSPVGASR